MPPGPVGQAGLQAHHCPVEPYNSDWYRLYHRIMKIGSQPEIWALGKISYELKIVT